MATAVGATGVALFFRSWISMQGLTLISVAVAIALVLGVAAVVTRRARPGLAPADRRQVYGRALTRLAGWALAGYVAYFIVVNMVLDLVGFKYPSMKM